MGHTQASDMAEAVQDGTIDLDMALQYHLQHNHYPPHPASMVDVARRTIEACNRGKYGKGIRLPEGVTYRGRPVPTAGEVVEALHLEPFIEEEA